MRVTRDMKMETLTGEIGLRFQIHNSFFLDDTYERMNYS